MQLLSYVPIFKSLLATDLLLLKQTIKDKLIDLFIWIITMVLVNTYLMPAFGLSQDYSGFLIASLIGSAGLFEVYSSATNFISDFTGLNITSFYLTLPMPSWLVWIEKLVYMTINTTVISILILPISKLLVWNEFSLAEFSLFKFCIVFLLSNIFSAAFALWITTRISGMEQIGSIWMRFVYPIWFLGGFQYSYEVLHQVSPIMAYVSLANPMLYVMEGMRASVLGQEGSLNFWFCCVMIALFTILCTWHGLKRLKTRLDYI
ncbi:MAG: ABC transporter permease [Candidatus Babeliales bacterium]